MPRQAITYPAYENFMAKALEGMYLCRVIGKLAYGIIKFYFPTQGMLVFHEVHKRIAHIKRVIYYRIERFGMVYVYDIRPFVGRLVETFVVSMVITLGKMLARVQRFDRRYH